MQWCLFSVILLFDAGRRLSSYYTNKSLQTIISFYLQNQSDINDTQAPWFLLKYNEAKPF